MSPPGKADAFLSLGMCRLVPTLSSALREFYNEHSVLCHRVYGEIFSYLLGRCAVCSQMDTPEYRCVEAPLKHCS